MARIVFCAWLTVIALGATACTGTVTRSPAPPPPSSAELPRSEAVPDEHAPPAQLTAPPPAYGNKIVMAKGRGATLTN